MAFTMMNFIPFYMLSILLGHPDSKLAVAMSMIPFTAPVSSMLRLAASGSHVPGWEIALSLSILVMFLLHQLQLLQERLVLDTENHVDERLLRHLHVH